MFDFYVLASFVGYLALMLGIGFFFSRKQEDLGDYYLGGRRMNKWVVALSAQASDMSGWLLMGLPGAIYVGGFSEAWIGIGLLIGTYLNWKIVAHRLRVYSHVCGDSITIPDFISNRFRDPTGISRIIAALIILVFFTFYTASGFVSCAKLFTSTFGIPDTVSRLAVGAVAIVALVMAMNTQSEFFKVVMKMVSFAWAGFGAAFGPLILLALFWRRTNLAGAIYGMVVGAVTCFVWKFVLSDYAGTHEIFGLYELAPGFLFAFVTTVIVSLVTQKPSAETLIEFDKVKEAL